MPTSSSVPAINWLPTGLQLPLESDILAGVQADMNAAFGGNLNPALNTPQGQLAQTQTAIIGDANNTFAQFVNQVNPDFATGFMQDAIGRIYYLTRKPAQPSSVVCTCVGAVGTNIPVNAQASDTNGNIWVCTQAGTIPSGGSINLTFASVKTGAIACPAGQLNKIYQSIAGWDTIVNAGDASLGTDVESRADFEFRRKQSVAINAKGSVPSINAAVFAVDGVTDCFVVDNPTGNTVLYGSTNYPLKPHSVYVAVVGGNAVDIAKAIWTKKDLGCDMNGNTSITVSDNTYSFPPPNYLITFNRPTDTPILFDVTIVNNSSLPLDIVSQIQNAVISSFTGADGGSRARIGGLLLASRYYQQIGAIGNYLEIISVQLGIASPTLNNLQLGIDQNPTISAANINVTLV